ncbi:hypothetical protein CGLAMM_04200 [Acetobacteraceae bacterium EV16G]|uniref:Uncharacterized protein n=1 Tax=Sorlinia euscelidii TaxID=3081148 RepID=A0ABU7U036_9PROT
MIRREAPKCIWLVFYPARGFLQMVLSIKLKEFYDCVFFQHHVALRPSRSG